MNALNLMLVGDVERSEFQAAWPRMDEAGAVWSFSTIEAAEAAMASRQVVPDVVVVAETFPGQFSHESLDRLRRAAPLARVIGLLGSWCEGEMRSGSPWPATARTYWHQWLARCRREFDRLSHGQPCAWALPVTASEEERILVESSRHTPCAVSHSIANNGAPSVPAASYRGLFINTESRSGVPPLLPRMRRDAASTAFMNNSGYRGLVALRSPSHEMADWLSAACRRLGFATLWQREVATLHLHGASAAIFDAADLREQDYEALRQLVHAVEPAPVAALLSFPRIEEHERIRSAGAVAVFSKPAAMEDLEGFLEPLVVR